MRRGVLRVDGRRVHYRRAGSGPALVLLHGSPNSSLSLEPMIERLARDFDCIAFDTPGNGCSDPLPEPAPATADYAAALGRAVDAFELGRFSLYGFHTGAGTAAEYAAMRPHRVASLVLDGVACWTPSEKAGMLEGYLPRFEPDWSGSHLAWLWSRVMEQTIFFPWHRPSRSTRMDYDMPPPEVLHRTAMEFLRAGDHYRKPYAAALAGDGAARCRRLKTPTLATAHPLDPIAHHLERLEGKPDCVTVVRETRLDRPAIWDSFRTFLLQNVGDAAPPDSAPSIETVEGFAGGLFWRGEPGPGRPLVLLHGPGASSELFADAIKRLDGARTVVAVDLPGHGESGGAMPASVDVAAGAVETCLSSLGLESPAVCGIHLGGMIAQALRRRGGAAAVAMIGAPRLRGPDYAPDLSPRWDGGHLLSAWHFIRLEALYADWRVRSRSDIFFGAPPLDVDSVHRRTIDLLKSADSLRNAYAAQDDWLARERSHARFDALFAASFDPMSAPSGFDGFSGARPVTLPDRPADWAAPLAEFGR